jgi:Cft2 family RNA processing exonuclease
LRKHRRQPHLHQAFVLSDHADFDQLVECLKATGAETFYFTHGYREAMQSYFAAKGYESYIWPDERPSTSTLFPPESSLEPDRPPGGPPLDHPRSQPPLPSPT